MGRLRVVVAEDSVTVRRRLVEILGADPELEVVGEAGDGKSAIDRVVALRPDVITMDMMMPVMTGLAAVEYIMAHVPTPILVVSASTNRGELFRTYEALAAGAVDVVEKPSGVEPDGVWERALVARVKLVARIRVITHLRGRRANGAREAAGEGALAGAQPVPAHIPAPAAPHPSSAPFPATTRPRLVAIGASTGGPGAVREIIRHLPDDFPLPILIVIHIGRPFGAALAEWLDGESGLRVAQAGDGDLPGAPGRPRILLAPPERHLLLAEGRVRLSDAPERHSCRPSVDVLFESVARELGAAAIGCLLTGMGRDGAAGLLALRSAGGVTLAQDEESSVVYGMPREAVLLGAAQRVLPIERIAPELVALARAGGRP